MTPDELYAKGYALQPGLWGCIIILENPDHMNDGAGVIARWTIYFREATDTTEACRLGWEAAEADFVMRRLT